MILRLYGRFHLRPEHLERRSGLNIYLDLVEEYNIFVVPDYRKHTQ